MIPKILRFEQHHWMSNRIWRQMMFLNFLFLHSMQIRIFLRCSILRISYSNLMLCESGFKRRIKWENNC